MLIFVVLILVSVIVITVASFFLIIRCDHIKVNIKCKLCKFFDFSFSADKHNEKLHKTEVYKCKKD